MWEISKVGANSALEVDGLVSISDAIQHAITLNVLRLLYFNHRNPPVTRAGATQLEHVIALGCPATCGSCNSTVLISHGSLFSVLPYLASRASSTAYIIVPDTIHFNAMCRSASATSCRTTGCTSASVPKSKPTSRRVLQYSVVALAKAFVVVDTTITGPAAGIGDFHAQPGRMVSQHVLRFERQWPVVGIRSACRDCGLTEQISCAEALKSSQGGADVAGVGLRVAVHNASLRASRHNCTLAGYVGSNNRRQSRSRHRDAQILVMTARTSKRLVPVILRPPPPRTMAPGFINRIWHPAPAPPDFGKGKTLPDAHANVLRIITFSWLTPLLSVGWSRPLEESGMSHDGARTT